MHRTSSLLALATLLLVTACGDDDGSGGRADASVNPVADAAVADASAEPDAGALPDAAVDDAGPDPDAMPDQDAGGMGGGLLITEIVDGTRVGGQPKVVELTNTSSTAIDMSQYSIGFYADGNTVLGGFDGALVLDGTLAAGDSYVVLFGTANGAEFSDVYGFPPDAIAASISFNGNDAAALFLGAATGDGSDATLVDVYGEIGMDGTGLPWEYTDGYAERVPASIEPSPTFSAADWSFSGVDALEGGDPQVHVDNTSPGTHTFDAP